MGYPILMYRVGGTAVPAPYTVYNTMRVSVHICVYTQEKGVGQQIKLVQLSTIDLVYTNIYEAHLGPTFTP